jgi:VIT1/CCC1 family predicted Fe2+/Mn2+ transporter
MSRRDNWHEEKQSAWLYRRLAEVERDPPKRSLFAALADAAESQAHIWAGQMKKHGETIPLFHPTVRARLVAWLVRAFGPRPVRPVLSAMKIRGLSVYRAPPLTLGHPMPRSAEDVGRGHRGIGSGNNLRAAVFGINDGLVSNTSLIMGVAGATADAPLILLSGIAGLLAGAFSMAAGEYVSVRSQREMYEYQIGLERQELEEYPDEEAEELALIYNARGMELSAARRFSTDLLRDPARALDVLAREELGLNPDELASPVGAAVSSFLSFAIGALLPLLPFLFDLGTAAVPVAAGLAAISLFAVGAALSLFTGRKAWRGGLRMLLIGGAAGLATYAIGSLFGVGVTS